MDFIDQMTPEYVLEFEEKVMQESGGSFSETDDIMREDSNINWFLVSKVILTSENGVCVFNLEFHYNKQVVIADYSPSVPDALFNPDLAFLTEWCVDNGWNKPQPTMFLVEDDMNFWKHFWETGIIESDYLCKVFRRNEMS
jgi:hypothetical protein